MERDESLAPLPATIWMRYCERESCWEMDEDLADLYSCIAKGCRCASCRCEDCPAIEVSVSEVRP